jgi:hypothetical protein
MEGLKIRRAELRIAAEGRNASAANSYRQISNRVKTLFADEDHEKRYVLFIIRLL